MIFGLLCSAQADNASLGAGIGQGFHDYIDFNLEAERLGYYSTFLVEHHFTGWGQVSSTLSLLTWLAARTKTLRIGTATIVLPWHNPVLLAEHVATLQLLSDGRVDLGIGKGYRYSEFKGFGIPAEEAEARFEECLDILLKSWSAPQRFSHHGTFWCFNDIVVEPTLTTRPAMWMGAGSQPSIRKVATRGFNLLLDQFADEELTGQRISMFKQAVEELGRSFKPTEVAVARDLYIAEDEEDKQAALQHLNAFRQLAINAARAPHQQNGSHILSYTSNGGLPSTESTLIGTIPEIADKLEALHDSGVDYVILSIVGGSRKTLRRFAAELMPRFVDELGGLNQLPCEMNAMRRSA